MQSPRFACDSRIKGPSQVTRVTCGVFHQLLTCCYCCLIAHVAQPMTTEELRLKQAEDEVVQLIKRRKQVRHRVFFLQQSIRVVFDHVTDRSPCRRPRTSRKFCPRLRPLQRAAANPSPPPARPCCLRPAARLSEVMPVPLARRLACRPAALRRLRPPVVALRRHSLRDWPRQTR